MNSLTKQKLTNFGIYFAIRQTVAAVTTWPRVVNFLISAKAPIHFPTQLGGGNTDGFTTHVPDSARGAPKMMVNFLKEFSGSIVNF